MHFSIVLFFAFWSNLAYPSEARRTHTKQHEIYDFIIVGGGTAGTVLATRLSEITSWKILLLEAGKRNHILNQLPAITTKYQGSSLDWRYGIEQQQTCCKGLKDKKLYWPAGKVLGGTSEINYMVYTRGNKEDYNRWARQGNPGWSYDDVLPYFLKSEKYRFIEYNRKYHSRDGLLSIEHPYTTNLTDTFLNGANVLGYDIHDYNGKTQIRFSKIKAHMDMGKRHSVFQAFLEPIYHRRKNLKIIHSAQVVKIIINPTSKKAVGAIYIRSDSTRRAFAKKEVILSAGVIGSAKILMLSGIGPEADLKQLHIPLLQNLTVGQGIRDHISYFGLNYLTNLQVNFNHFEHHAVGISSCDGGKKCLASSPAGIEAIGFVKLNNSNAEENTPDVEILLVNHLINKDLKILTNIEETVYKKCFQMVEEHVGANVFPILLHPKSTGFIKLRSKNPCDTPIIQPNYLSVQEDVKKMVNAIKFVESLTETGPFVNADAALYPVPVCDDHELYSEDYWECAVKTLTMSFNDYMGGCKMGPNDDKEAVVDNKLQVYGIKNLMVVDASVIPVTISGHVGAATIMIGEKAADIIKDKYNA